MLAKRFVSLFKRSPNPQSSRCALLVIPIFAFFFLFFFWFLFTLPFIRILHQQLLIHPPTSVEHGINRLPAFFARDIYLGFSIFACFMKKETLDLIFTIFFHWFLMDRMELGDLLLSVACTCSSSIKPSEDGVNRSWGRKAVSFVLITVTGGVALSALDDLAIYRSCSRYVWLVTDFQIWMNYIVKANENLNLAKINSCILGFLLMQVFAALFHLLVFEVQGN